MESNHESSAVDVKAQTREILNSLSKREVQLLQKVIDAEKKRIGMKNPKGIYDDIRESIENIYR
jgi:FixJ family two-component response regulator